MDYSPSDLPESDVLSPFPRPVVTEEQFRAFHNIDRILFTRLVQGLGREPAESLQVMALLLFMERSGATASAVYKIATLPDTIVHAVADEAAMCLKCIDTDVFLFAIDDDVPLIGSLVGKNGTLSLRHFFDNRVAYVRGVTRVVNEVCSRAFEDLVRLAEKQKRPVKVYSPAAGFGGERGECSVRVKPQPQPQPPLIYNYNLAENHPVYYYPGVVDFGRLNVHAPAYMPAGKARVVRAVDPYDFEGQRTYLNRDMSEILARIVMPDLGGPGDQEERILGKPADGNGRTLFLTFSKGYHVTEREVRDFFSRRFPDVYVETIIMQETAGEEQPLFARLVVGCAEDIGRILEGIPKAKFNINGKHVWARKYVHKTCKPFSSSPTPSQPSSPILRPF